VIQLHRLIRILWVFSKYRLDEFLRLLSLPLGIRIILATAPWRLFPARHESRGERLRLAMEELGPVFVKFGQILSTRRDLLPDDMAEALQYLQDRVPPFPSDQAREIIEADLGGTVGDMFSEFERDPLASASVAQVHGARLHDGRAVIVKVIRPGIERVIRQDIRLLYLMAGLLERYWSEGRRLHPVEVVSDYEKTIFDELDMQREGANASQLRRNFPDSSLIYVPDVYWPYTSKRVVTMERVSGIPIRGYPGAARRRGRHEGAGGKRGGNFLHPGLPGQLLPRGHAPGQYLRERQQPSRPPVHRPGFRYRGHPRTHRQELPGAQPACFL